MLAFRRRSMEELQRRYSSQRFDRQNVRATFASFELPALWNLILKIDFKTRTKSKLIIEMNSSLKMSQKRHKMIQQSLLLSDTHAEPRSSIKSSSTARS